tara:strand:- start:75 stop:1028 length:954 start_codon:yes stop_codon:yes gene_type:complete
MDLLLLIWNVLNTQLTSLQGNPVTLLGIIQVLLIALITYLIANRIASRVIKEVASKAGLTASGSHLAGTLVRGSVLFIGIYIALSALGFDLGVLLVPLGAVGIGLGFGLQRIAENFVSGLIMLSERPIKDGDIIEVNGVRGVVERIGLRATIIRTFEFTQVIVPNSQVLTNQVDNWTHTDMTVRIKFTVGVAYGTNTRKAEKLILGVIQNHPDVLDTPEPKVFFIEFGDSALNFRVYAWVDAPAKRLATLSDLHYEIDRVFAQESIQIPFPQRDLHIKSNFANPSEVSESSSDDTATQSGPNSFRGRRSNGTDEGEE